MKWIQQGRVAKAGFTLLELLIAMALGVLVIVGMVQLYGSVARAATTANQASSLSETGTIALYRLTDPIRQAGYGEICCSNTATNLAQTLFSGTSIKGCSAHPFSDSVSFGCNTAAAGSDTLVTRFQANSADAVTASNQASITDCAGQPALMASSSQSTQIAVVQDIYSFDSANSRVVCSNGSATETAVTVVPDVADFRLFYGFDDAGYQAALNGANPTLPVATSLLTASEISGKQAGNLDPWEYVISVDLCLDLKSSLDGASVSSTDHYTRCPYTDAEASQGAPSVTVTDHRLHRAFRKLIAIRAHANADPTLEVPAVAAPPP